MTNLKKFEDYINKTKNKFEFNVEYVDYYYDFRKHPINKNEFLKIDGIEFDHCVLWNNTMEVFRKQSERIIKKELKKILKNYVISTLDIYYWNFTHKNRPKFSYGQINSSDLFTKNEFMNCKDSDLSGKMISWNVYIQDEPYVDSIAKSLEKFTKNEHKDSKDFNVCNLIEWNLSAIKYKFEPYTVEEFKDTNPNDREMLRWNVELSELGKIYNISIDSSDIGLIKKEDINKYNLKDAFAKLKWSEFYPNDFFSKKEIIQSEDEISASTITFWNRLPNIPESELFTRDELKNSKGCTDVHLSFKKTIRFKN